MHEIVCGERWAPVPGYSAYEVSDQGQIRSWKARANASSRDKRAAQPHPLKRINGRYFTVVLCGDTGRRTWAVHQIVATAFLGERPEGKEIRHLNGDRYDCRVANLAYGTPKQNVADTVRHGTAWYLRPDVIARRTIAWRQSMGIEQPRMVRV